MSSSFDASSDLDSLMARVREAATRGGDDSSTLKAIAADNRGGLDLLQLIALQDEWNDRTAQSLATIVECLQGLQEQWASLEARLRDSQARPGSVQATPATVTAAPGARTAAKAVAARPNTPSRIQTRGRKPRASRRTRTS